MAMTQTTRLGCGRDLDEVWDSVDRPPNEHEQTCPYCTTARSDLAELSAATRELTVTDRRDSTLRVPHRMLSEMVAIVRTEVRRGRTIPLQRRTSVPQHNADGTGDGGDGSGADSWSDLTVSEQVIAMVVREVCDRNPDVEVRRISIDVPPAPTLTSGTPPRSPGEVVPADLRLTLQTTVSHSIAIPALLEGLRTAIASAVFNQIGVTVSRIDVEVQDLIDA